MNSAVSEIAATWERMRAIPWPLRFYVFIPATAALVVAMGFGLTLPPGPLCDEGMVLFMEGGCDWGESNIFFFSKLGLLIAANVAFAVCAWRRPASLEGFLPHLLVLGALSWIERSGGRCDTYYSHPNGSLGQMTVEVAAFSVLGLTLLQVIAGRSRGLVAAAMVGWNATYVGTFYAWLSVVPHWTWLHTWLICGTLLGAVAVLVAVWRPAIGTGPLLRTAVVSAALLGVLALAFMALEPTPSAIALAVVVGVVSRFGLRRMQLPAWMAVVPAAVVLIGARGVSAVESRLARAQAPNLSPLVERVSAELSPAAAHVLRAEGMSLRRAVGEDATVDLARLSPEARKLIETIVATPGNRSSTSVTVFVPLTDGVFFSFFGAGSSAVARLTRLRNPYTSTTVIDCELYESLLTTGSPIRKADVGEVYTSVGTDFVQKTRVNQFNGWAVRDETNAIVAVAAVSDSGG